MSEPNRVDDGSLPLLGCIADDVTGATDLALNLVQGGMRVIQWLGVPSAAELQGLDVDAVVIALKSRSIPTTDAVAISMQAWEALHAAGCSRCYFKYCSTFDSTGRGNIGPVAEALMAAVGCRQTIFCPAFPEAGRTVYAGHLFVNGALLNESGMENHPLNPMRDPSLLRVLGRQSTRPVGLLAFDCVNRGPAAIAEQLESLQRDGEQLVVTDCLGDGHLGHLAQALVDWPLVTGGSGLARFLPGAYRERGLLQAEPHFPQLPEIQGRAAIISGSCSPATCRQVTSQAALCATWRIDVERMMRSPGEERERILSWVSQQPPSATVMIASTAEPDQVAANQDRFGGEVVAGEIERLQSAIAAKLVEDFGVRRLIVAGGETASAVAAALKIEALRIGPAIAPGVPWTESLAEQPLALAFKSGNFGGDDFFHSALEMLG